MSWKQHQLRNIFQLFGGMNCNDTPDEVARKNQAEYILNCYNYPEKGIARFFGRSKHNSIAIGSDDEITGIFELKITNPAFFCIAENKFYKDNSGTWEDRTGSVVITDNKNNLWDFFKFADVMIGTSLSRDTPIEHDGGTGNLANVSNMPVVKFCKPFKNRIIAYNTVAQPKLGYWCAVDDRNTWDTTNDYLNFKATESDDEEISGVAEYLDSHIIAKESSMFRLYHTGTSPPFKYYKIAGKNGCTSHFSMQSIPAIGMYPPRLIWMGKDNFYQLVGDEITSCGDDIKPFFSEGAFITINQARIPYCVSGLIKEKNLYICAWTSGSGVTHNYLFILDYKNMMWTLSDFTVNSFGIRQISSRNFLYSGTYDGFVCKHDPAVYNNMGSAYSSIYTTSWLSSPDPQREEQMQYLIALMDAVGNFNLAVEYRTNLSKTWVSLGNFNSATSDTKLGIDWILGTSVLGGADLTESVLEVLKRFKRIQFRFTMSTIDEYFRLYALAAIYKIMEGYRIGVSV